VGRASAPIVSYSIDDPGHAKRGRPAPRVQTARPYAGSRYKEICIYLKRRRRFWLERAKGRRRIARSTKGSIATDTPDAVDSCCNVHRHTMDACIPHAVAQSIRWRKRCRLYRVS